MLKNRGDKSMGKHFHHRGINLERHSFLSQRSREKNKISLFLQNPFYPKQYDVIFGV